MMRRVYTACLLLCTFFASSQLAIKLTPLTVFRNMKYTLHGEYLLPESITGKYSISVALGWSPNLFPKSSGLDSDKKGNYYYTINFNKSNAGFAIDPELRWYFKKPMQRYFLGVYSSFRTSTSVIEEYLNKDTSNTYFNPTLGYQNLSTLISVFGIQMGYQKVFGPDNRFILDTYIGFGNKITNRNYDRGYQLSGPGYKSNIVSGIALRGNVSIGFLLIKPSKPL